MGRFILVLHGLSSCFTLGEIFFRNEEGNPHTQRLHVSDYIYSTLRLCNYWIFFLALSFTFYGLSVIICTLIIIILVTRFFIMLGPPLWRLVWPLGWPLTFLSIVGIVTNKLSSMMIFLCNVVFFAFLLWDFVYEVFQN
jgi:hypothetical protein